MHRRRDSEKKKQSALGGSREEIYLGCGVSVVQQPELHQSRDFFEIRDRLSRLLQNNVKDSELYCLCNRLK